MKRNPTVYLFDVITAIILFAQIPPCIALHASDSPDIKTEEGKTAAFALRGSAGYLNGEARELVYDSDAGSRRKASELIWDLDSLYMVGAVASASICNWFNINVGIWTACNEGSGGMVDYDWILDTPMLRAQMIGLIVLSVT
jgi:outer membrane protease